jgi:hypothetical protein
MIDVERVLRGRLAGQRKRYIAREVGRTRSPAEALVKRRMAIDPRDPQLAPQ